MSIAVTDLKAQRVTIASPSARAQRNDEAPLGYDNAKLKARDPAEFDWLVLQESPRIQTLVTRLLGWEYREDVAQDVFVTAWETIDRFRGDADVATWLYSIAINRCRNQRRRASVWRRCLQAMTQLKGTPLPPVDVARQEAIEFVYYALNRLSHSDRETIVLCCLEGRPIDEVAVYLKKSRNAVEVRLHRAREKLKSILDKMESE